MPRFLIRSWTNAAVFIFHIKTLWIAWRCSSVAYTSSLYAFGIDDFNFLPSAFNLSPCGDKNLSRWKKHPEWFRAVGNWVWLRQSFSLRFYFECTFPTWLGTEAVVLHLRRSYQGHNIRSSPWVLNALSRSMARIYQNSISWKVRSELFFSIILSLNPLQFHYQ